MPHWLKTIVSSLAILALYAAARFIVYAYFPITNLEEWFLRDVMMTVPRVLCFFLTLLVLRKTAPRGDDWRRIRPRVLLFGFFAITIWTFYFSQSEGQRFARWMIPIGIVTSIIVGLFEETLYRGALFRGLSERFSIQSTILLSTAAFAVSHIQAQSFAMWIPIFFTGLIFANLRARAASLLELTIIHSAIDSVYFFFPSVTPNPLFGFGFIFTACLAILAIVTFPCRPRT